MQQGYQPRARVAKKGITSRRTEVRSIYGSLSFHLRTFVRDIESSLGSQLQQNIMLITLPLYLNNGESETNCREWEVERYSQLEIL